MSHNECHFNHEYWIVIVFKTCFHTSPKTYVVGAQKINLNDNETVLLEKTDDTQKICVREYNW